MDWRASARFFTLSGGPVFGVHFIEHLAALWKQREEIIIHPFVLNLFGGQQAVLRIDAHQYKAIDLSRSENKELPLLTSEIPLDSVAVEPGKFFLSADRTLGYWHKIKVPGRSIDHLLTLANTAINQQLAQEIPKELKRRADGGAVGTWDELRRAILKEIESERKSPERAKNGEADAGATKPQPPPAIGPQADNGLPLDNDSLERLQKAVAAGELVVARYGGEFSISIPLSVPDCREAKATIDACQEGLDKRLPRILEPLVKVAELSKSIEAQNDADKRLIVKFRVSRLVAVSFDAPYPTAKPNPDLAARYRDVIDFVRGHKMPIDDKLTLKEVIDSLAGE